jgi:hypothetical protein
MLRILPIVSAFVFLAASGISHRLWTGSWTITGEPGLSAARLAEVPATIGDWVGVDQEVDARQLARAEAAGYLARRYVQRLTNAEVSVFIICGRPGPVAVHTPDICYSGLGFQLTGTAAPYEVEGDTEMPPAAFFRGNFEKADPTGPTRLRIYWAWKAGRGWKAAAHPRMSFGGLPALYKLYLVYRRMPGDELPEQDPCQDFMHDLLPELEKVLSPPS